MTTSKEVVAQRPLAGRELSKIILDDCSDMLQQNGYLTGQIAFSRVSYEVRIVIHADNPAYPVDTTMRSSKPRPRDITAVKPELAAIEPGPKLVAPSKDAIISAVERNRAIESPNAARVEHSLPMTILRQGQDGHLKEEKLTYNKDMLEGQPNPNPPPIDTDIAERLAAEWEQRS